MGNDGAALLRVLFITLEFKAGAFSGNGVYAQSQVRALRNAGHSIFVVSGRPEDIDTAPLDNDVCVATEGAAAAPGAGAHTRSRYLSNTRTHS